jgi:rod shape-determining protein MreC
MPSSRRNRIILIVIIIVCISLVTLYIRESDTGPLHRIQNFFLDLLSPVSNFFSKIFRPFKDGIVNLFHLPSLSKEKRELQKEVNNLQRQASESKELEAQVAEFKKLLNWSEENAQLDTVGADIVGQSPSNWQRVMIVNKGSSDGIKKYMSVVTEEGLAGRIISVGSHSSVVQLITDSRSAIGARDLRSRETGIIEGGNVETMRFVPMNDDAVIHVDDVMVSSGLGGTSPPGIVIGKVTRVVKRSAGLARLVEVKPFVKFSQLDKVLIIITPEPESVILKGAQ